MGILICRGWRFLAVLESLSAQKCCAQSEPEVQNLYRIERMGDERDISFEERAKLRGELAAANTAVICSLLGSCKEQGVNPREWLTGVIAQMPYYQKPGNEENLHSMLMAGFYT